jgi:hypothetical protein
VRLNGSDLTPGGLEPADYAQVARMIEATGVVDYISITAGTSRDNNMIVPPMDVPHGVFADYAPVIRQQVGLPVFAVGRIKTPAFAESVLSEGKADVVAVCRALIADPFWVDKAARAPETIRPCIGCNQGCFGYLYTNRPITCTVNPAVGREAELGAGTCTGGEPRTPGCWLRVAARPAWKQRSPPQNAAIGSRWWKRLTHWAGRSISRVGRLHVGNCWKSPRSSSANWSAWVWKSAWASGSRRRGHWRRMCWSWQPDPRRRIQPVDTDGSVPVLSPAEILRQLRDGADHWRGRRVTVIDAVGHFPAYAPAEALAAAGARVTLLTSRLHAGSLLDNGSMINTLRRLGTAGVRVEAQRATIAVRAGAVQTRHIFTGDNETWPSDMVVAAVGNLPDDTLLDAPQATRIGDCQAPRTLLDAIREGRIAGRAA